MTRTAILCVEAIRTSDVRRVDDSVKAATDRGVEDGVFDVGLVEGGGKSIETESMTSRVVFGGGKLVLGRCTSARR